MQMSVSVSCCLYLAAPVWLESHCVLPPVSSLSPSRLQNNYCVPSELSSAAPGTAQLCSAAFTPWQCSPLPAVAQPNLAARKLPRSQSPGWQNRLSEVKLNLSPIKESVLYISNDISRNTRSSLRNTAAKQIIFTISKVRNFLLAVDPLLA